MVLRLLPLPKMPALNKVQCCTIVDHNRSRMARASMCSFCDCLPSTWIKAYYIAVFRLNVSKPTLTVEVKYMHSRGDTCIMSIASSVHSHLAKVSTCLPITNQSNMAIVINLCQQRLEMMLTNVKIHCFCCIFPPFATRTIWAKNEKS